VRWLRLKEVAVSKQLPLVAAYRNAPERGENLIELTPASNSPDAWVAPLAVSADLTMI
jgi:hypothetical protein